MSTMKALTQPRRRRLGTLDIIEFPAAADSPVIVCCHGYGADAADVAPIAMELDLPRSARWVFPDGPLRLPGAYGPGGRAWFPIDQERLARIQMGGEPAPFADVKPPGLEEAVQDGLALIEALESPWDRLVLGGFSQGAMLALELTLRGPSAPRGLFLLSGNLVDEVSVRQLAPARAGLPFFQSHGTEDPILAYEGAKGLEEVLTGAGLKGSLLTFEGGHAIPRDVLEAFESFLAGLF